MTTLVGEWTDLLARRPSLREALEPLGGVFAAWNSWPARSFAPAECSAERARVSWSNGTPLVEIALPSISPESIEPALLPALDVLDGIEDTRTFTAAWDAGDIGPAALLPSGGRPGGAVIERCRLTQAAAAFLAIVGLRAPMTAWFAGCQPLVADGYWDLGTCPCCGASAGCAELLEDGKRRLACHLCDTRWTFSRLICPLCGNRSSDDLLRLIAEGADEGYGITACRACRGYIKEIDRRARWNAASAIVEDLGSPHLDLIAHRQGYWRPIPTLIQLTDSSPG
jgi:hypothetical protein